MEGAVSYLLRTGRATSSIASVLEHDISPLDDVQWESFGSTSESISLLNLPMVTLVVECYVYG